eukprot:g1032.t1
MQAVVRQQREIKAVVLFVHGTSITAHLTTRSSSWIHTARPTSPGPPSNRVSFLKQVIVTVSLGYKFGVLAMHSGTGGGTVT